LTGRASGNSAEQYGGDSKSQRVRRPVAVLDPDGYLFFEETPMPPSAVEACPDAVPRTLEDLLRASAAGDQQAFALLYERLVTTVLSTVRAVVHDREQSLDIAQEVFVQLWREAPRYSRDKGNVLTWARVIAHRRAVER
jgi:hypothetical protein